MLKLPVLPLLGLACALVMVACASPPSPLSTPTLRSTPSAAPTASPPKPSPTASYPAADLAYLNLVVTDTTTLSASLTAEAAACQANTSSTCLTDLTKIQTVVQTFLASLNRTPAPDRFAAPDATLRRGLQSADDALNLTLNGWNSGNLSWINQGSANLKAATTLIASAGNQLASLLPS